MCASVEALGGRRVVPDGLCEGLDKLPKSNVLRLLLEDESAVIV